MVLYPTTYTFSSTQCGVPSASKLYLVTRKDVSADILITPPTGIEVSKDNITFSSAITLPAATGSKTDTFYIRVIKPTAPSAAKTGNITITSTGSSTAYTWVSSGTIGKYDTPITWSAPASITYGTLVTAIQKNATKPDTITGTIAYTPISDTLYRPGTYTLTAKFTPSNTTNYNTITKTVSITVNKIKSVITWADPADIYVGTALSGTQLNAAIDASDSITGTFTYLPASGTVLSIGDGQKLTTKFTPDAAFVALHDEIYDTAVINVKPKINPIITWENPADLLFGEKISATQLNASTDVAGSFTYSVAIDSVLAVGNTQKLKTIFTPTDATIYNVVSDSVLINVRIKSNPSISWSNPDDITMGDKLTDLQLNATADPSGGSFVYNPAKDSVLLPGTQTLRVVYTPVDSKFYYVVSDSVTLNVIDTTKASPLITWAVPAAISYGAKLTATELNASATDTATLASVPGEFVYTPAIDSILNAGVDIDLKVKFTPTDNATYNSATKSVKITVNKATPVVTWSNPANILFGNLLSATQLNATASVDGSFVYTPAAGISLAAGSHNIIVTFTPTSSNYSVVKDTVQITVTKTVPEITWANPADITFGTALSATQLNANAGSLAGAFSYSPASGTILNAGANQDITATFTPTDLSGYSIATKTIKINVLKATPTVTWATPASIVYGTKVSATQLNATASVAGAFVYSAKIDSILKAGDKVLTVNFTPTDAANYNTPAAKTVTIAVTKATPVITWANPADIAKSTALSATQLNATASVPGTFAYTPASGTSLTAGTAKDLTVLFTPTDAANYTTATKTVKINVIDNTSVASTKIENSAYPNPFTSYINISNNGDITKLTVSDLAGRVVYTNVPVSSSLIQVSLSSLNSGTYILTIEKGLTKSYSTIVKK
jgi:hypothetical protein